MAHLTAFERKLDQLFLDRTFNLRSMLGFKNMDLNLKLHAGKLIMPLEICKIWHQKSWQAD